MKRSAYRPALEIGVIALLIAIAFYVRSLSFFRTRGLVEFGDNGVNEIQINGALHFIETFGNYSRWTFHHPGPAFYYIYAFGQFVFYRGIHITRSPLAAHYLTAILLQATCLAFVAVMIGRRLQIAAFVPVAVAFWTFHILHTDLTPATIWPPSAVIGPLMVVVVSASLAASGEAWALMPLAISDGLLVNGHVAQPLFVGPLTLSALAIGFLTRRLPRNRRTLAWLIGSVAVGLIFLLPLALDALGGRSSNAAIIVQHLRTHGGIAHTFRRSLGYLLSFVVYQDGTETVQGGADFTLASYVSEHEAALAAFAVAVVGSTAWLLARYRSRFVLSLLGAIWLAIALTLIWGMRQDGPMYKFNGYLDSGLVYLVYVPALALTATALRAVLPARILTSAAIVTAIVFLFLQPRLPSNFVHSVAKLNERVRRAATERGATGVVLDFGTEDSLWLEASGVAEMLLEDGLSIRAPTFAAWLFRPRNAWSGNKATDDAWRTAHHPITLRVAKATGTPGELPLPDDGRTVFSMPGRPVAVTIEPE